MFIRNCWYVIAWDHEIGPDALFSRIEDGTFGETYATETAPELRQVATQEQYERIGQTIRTRLGR